MPLLGPKRQGPCRSSTLDWTLGDFLGVVTLLPLLAMWRGPQTCPLFERGAEGVLLFLIHSFLCWLLMASEAYPNLDRAVFTIPTLTWAMLRFNRR